MIPVGAIDIENETDFDLDLDSYIAQARFMFERLRLHPETEVSICFVDEERMSQLHVEWMEEPGPTDVLSFPMDELRVPEWNEKAPTGILGDIVLCPAFARRQAEQAGQSMEDELAMLLTHGILHCLGHDHAEPEEHKVMFDLQHELLEAWWRKND